MKKHNDTFKTFEDGFKEWSNRYSTIEKNLGDNCPRGSLKFHSKDGIPYRLISDIDGCRALGVIFNIIDIENDYKKVIDYVGMQVGVNLIAKDNIEVVLTCKSSEHARFYIQLFYDLITDLGLIEGTKARYMELFRWVKKKAALFEELSVDCLPLSKEKGLFGELETMDYIKENTELSWLTILNGWRGCDGDPIDFDFSKVAVETKIISFNEVTFHGVYQTSFVKKTFLQAIALKESIGQGESLKDKINRLKISMELNEVALFEKCLRAYGYFSSLNLSEKKFEVTDIKSYDMTSEDFPKYSIDPEYSKVKLSLSLQAIEKYTLPPETITMAIGSNEGKKY